MHPRADDEGTGARPFLTPQNDLWHVALVTEILETTVPALAARARAVAADRPRVIIGIAGAPGAGKSTLATQLVEQLGPQAAVVAMDGFHLAQQELHRLGRADRKGAPDTFDVDGYVALLRRLRDAAGATTVYAPTFRRDIEEPIANAVAIPPDVCIVVTEGNYLLLDEPGWREVRPLLDETWFVDTDATRRRRRLIARRVAVGTGYEDARRWVLGSDERNAGIVAHTRARADVVVHLTESTT